MKSYNKYLLTLFSALALSSCKVQDTAVPKDAFPAQFRGAGTSVDSTSAADIEWRTFITDPTLQKLIDSALTRNPDLLIAQKSIEAAQLRLGQAKWGNVPELNAQTTAASSRLSDNSLNGLSTSTFLGKHHVEDYNVNLGLSWEADIWGKIRNTKKAALAEFLQSGEAKKALQTTIVANVSRGYYNLLMLDAQLEIARKNVSLADSTLTIINLQFESGQVTSLAQQQATAQKTVAAQLLPVLQQQTIVQENALSLITGNFPSAKERSITLNSLVVPETLSTGVAAETLSRRPDVKSAEYALDVANANVGVAKSFMYPSLRITAATGLTSFESSNWFNIPASVFGTVAGSLTQPLLNGKKLRTRYELAKNEREQRVLAFRKSVLNAAGEVSNALMGIENLKAEQSIVAERVTALQTAIKNADMLFKNGLATYLEVIIAQGNLLQSELELASIKRQRLEANIELYRSLGGGWK